MDITSANFLGRLGGLNESSRGLSSLIWAGVTGVVIVFCVRFFQNLSSGNPNNQISKIFKSRQFFWVTVGGIILAKRLIEKNSLPYKIATLVISIGTASFTNCFLKWVQSKKQKPVSIQKKKVQSIPEKWEEDKIFQQSRCAINLYPTLNPVGDPKAKTELYDKPTVLNWVRKHHTSPLTREPLQLWKVCYEKKAVKSLMYYRVRQLEEYEKTLDGPLLPKENLEHSKWVEKSAGKLNDEIKSFINLSEMELKQKFEEFTEIPPFLAEIPSHWIWCCSDTGKPILHGVLPKVDDSLLKKNSYLLRIHYEQSRINELLSSSQVPKNWPINLLPFNKENLIEYPGIRNKTEWEFIGFIEELKRYYTPFDSLEDDQSVIQNVESIEIKENESNDNENNENKDI